jgi:hypothetical protein
MSLQTIISYFFPYEKPIMKARRHIARNIENAGATDDEITLIRRGLARNKQEAQALLLKHQAKHSADVIKAMKKRRGITFKKRLQSLLMRIEGASWRNVDKL